MEVITKARSQVKFLGGLIAWVVAFVSAVSNSVEAGITFLTDRFAWEAAAGMPMFTENFSGFLVDTPFHSLPVALNGMVIQQEGTERMAWNEVDVPSLQFTPNSGNSAGLLLTNFPEGGSSGIQIRITFSGLNKAFGLDSWSGNDGEGAVLDVFNNADRIGSQALTGGNGDFLGYILTGTDTSSAVRLRSNLLTPGMVGERFYIDNLTGINAVTLTGDYSPDGVIDAADYEVWRAQFGGNVAEYSGADGSGNGFIDAADYVVWRNNFMTGGNVASTAVPEPNAAVTVLVGVVGLAFRRRFAPDG
jgi:hypothetical protein